MKRRKYIITSKLTKNNKDLIIAQIRALHNTKSSSQMIQETPQDLIENDALEINTSDRVIQQLCTKLLIAKITQENNSF